MKLNMNTLRRPEIIVPAGLMAAALVLGGCNRETAAEPSQETSPTPTHVYFDAPVGAPHVYALTFNALGGGSSVIEVYPGVTRSTKDLTYNATYADGQTAATDCVRNGREVRSHPELGEQPRESGQWYHLVLPEGSNQSQFASAVYADVVQAADVPACK